MRRGFASSAGADQSLNGEDCGSLGPVVGGEVTDLEVEGGCGWVAVGRDLLLHCLAGRFAEAGAFSGDDDAVAHGEVGDGSDEPTESAGGLIHHDFGGGLALGG